MQLPRFKQARAISPEELRGMLIRPAPPTQDELDAVYRLLDVASSDTGQSRRVANFLLSWWNADRHGGFDLRDVWSVDQPIADDMVAVFALLARWSNKYPDSFDPAFGPLFEKLSLAYKPADDVSPSPAAA